MSHQYVLRLALLEKFDLTCTESTGPMNLHAYEYGVYIHHIGMIVYIYISTVYIYNII